MIDVTGVNGLIANGRLREAEQLCLQAIQVNREDPQAWFYLAAVQSQTDRITEAVGSLASAANLPAPDSFHLRVAQAMMRLHAFEPALPVFERLDTSQPRVMLDLARCRWGVGQYAAALKHLEGLWAARPDWAELASVYAWALGNLDVPETAGRVLREGLVRHPDHQILADQYVCWMVSHEGTAAAYDWLRGQRFPEPSERISLLTSGLAEVGGEQYPPPDRLSGQLLAQWQGFRELTGSGEKPAWFGNTMPLLRQAVEAAPGNGILVECGVAFGRSINLMARWSGREIHGFDSFQGLPEAWREHYPAGTFSAGGKLPRVAGNVQLHPGWFEDTLPRFASELTEPVALLYVDCDLYSSTRTVLEALGPHLAPGALVVFDEYTGYPGWREHERKAWVEYLDAGGVQACLHSAELLGQTVAWRV